MSFFIIQSWVLFAFGKIFAQLAQFAPGKTSALQGHGQTRKHLFGIRVEMSVSGDTHPKGPIEAMEKGISSVISWIIVPGPIAEIFRCQNNIKKPAKVPTNIGNFLLRVCNYRVVFQLYIIAFFLYTKPVDLRESHIHWYSFVKFDNVSP